MFKLIQNKTVSLYTLANWVNGLAFKDINFSQSGIPVIKISELKNGITDQTKYTQDKFDDSVRLHKGDMLFSWSGNPETSIDTFIYGLTDGWLNQHIFKVTPKDIDSKYFYYVMKSLNPTFKRIASNKQTTGLGHVTVKDLKEIEIYIPSFKEQQHIVNILGTIDNKIENNEKKIIELNKLMLTVFKDFQNKLLGHEPVPLGEYISFIKGKKPNDMQTHLLPYLSIEAMTTNNYEYVCSDGMILANTNDILMVMDGASSGTVYSGYNGIVGSTLAKLNCKNDEISILIEQRLIQMQNKIRELNTGSAIPHANKEFIQSITIKLSNDEFQTKIINQLSFLKQKILSCRSLNIQLVKLKNFYLKKFFK